MTKHHTTLCIILVLTLLGTSAAIWANAAPEDQAWSIPNTNTTNPFFYFDLADATIKDEILQIGNTLINQTVTVTITSPQYNFQFINDENSTARHSYSLTKHELKYSRDVWWIFGWITGSWNNPSPTNEVTYSNTGEISIQMPNAVYPTNILRGPLKSFSLLVFSINIPPAAQNLQSGTYTTKLLFTITAKNSQGVSTVHSTRELTLKAKYKTSVESGADGFTDFNLSITPTAYTYNFDIANNTGYVDIANINFSHASVSSSSQSYPNYPFVIGVSASPHGWTATAEPYTFRKIGSEYQQESAANTIEYTTRLVNQNNQVSSMSQPTDGRSQFPATHTINNQQIAGNKYLNEFQYTGKAQIAVTGTNKEDLASGRYSTAFRCL